MADDIDGTDDAEPVVCKRCGKPSILPRVFQPYLCEQCMKELHSV